MTRDRGYPDWLVLSARLLRSGYHSAGCVWLVAMCSLLLYVVIFQSQFYLMSINNLACALDPFPLWLKYVFPHFYFNRVIVNVQRTCV